jgi:hypothetical protein
VLRALRAHPRMQLCAALRILDVLADDIALEQRRFAVRGFDSSTGTLPSGEIFRNQSGLLARSISIRSNGTPFQ